MDATSFAAVLSGFRVVLCRSIGNVETKLRILSEKHLPPTLFVGKRRWISAFMLPLSSALGASSCHRSAGGAYPTADFRLLTFISQLIQNCVRGWQKS